MDPAGIATAVVELLPPRVSGYHRSSSVAPSEASPTSATSDNRVPGATS